MYSGVLPRNKTQPGGELPAVIERAPISDRRDDGGCRYRAHAFHFSDPLTQRIAPESLVYSPLQFVNPGVEGREFFVQGCEQALCRIGQPLLTLVDYLHQRFAELTEM